MKITKKQLKKIIKEEIKNTLAEVNPLAGVTRAAPVGGRPQPTGTHPLAGVTTADPTLVATSADAAGQGNEKLKLVAQQLQVLVNKIKQELGK